MKKLGIYTMAVLMLGIGTLNTGCMGQFALIRKVYTWNKSMGDKWIQSVVMWVLIIVPVYPVCGLIDFWFLNLIEFWTGSNPVAMNPGEKEQQTVKGKDGNMYEITATQNRFDIVQLTGERKGNQQSLLFNPAEGTCSVVVNGVETKLVKYDEKTNMIELFRPDGSSVHMDANTSPAMAREMFTSDVTFAAAK
jgi:hypothetical protein